MLNDLDKELTRLGHRFCRYADDCNIYVRSPRAGERVMASVSRILTIKLRLKVNETKSAVARPEERKFLGFSISNDGSERRIAPKALDKFKERTRELTSRTRGLSLSQFVEELTPYLIGWRGYFGFCQTPRALTILESDPYARWCGRGGAVRRPPCTLRLVRRETISRRTARKAVSLMSPFGQRTRGIDRAPLLRAPLFMPDGIQGREIPLIPRTRWPDAEPCRVHLLKW